MTAGLLLSAFGALLLLTSAIVSLIDAVRVHFLRRAEVDGKTRMKLWPVWVGIAGGIVMLLATWIR